MTIKIIIITSVVSQGHSMLLDATFERTRCCCSRRQPLYSIAEHTLLGRSQVGGGGLGGIFYIAAAVVWVSKGCRRYSHLSKQVQLVPSRAECSGSSFRISSSNSPDQVSARAAAFSHSNASLGGHMISAAVLWVYETVGYHVCN